LNRSGWVQDSEARESPLFRGGDMGTRIFSVIVPYLLRFVNRQNKGPAFNNLRSLVADLTSAVCRVRKTWNPNSRGVWGADSLAESRVEGRGAEAIVGSGDPSATGQVVGRQTRWVGASGLDALLQ